MRPARNRPTNSVIALSLVLAVGAAAATALAQTDKSTEAQTPAQPARERIVIPPPSAAEFEAKPAPEALAMGMAEARQLFLGSDTRVGGKGLRIAIIDSGYRGLKEWLELHPGEKETTHYVTSEDFTRDEPDDHGFVVYRVMREVMPDATLYLYGIDLGGRIDSIVGAILHAGLQGVPIANISLAEPSFEIVEGVGRTTWLVDQLEVVLRHTEISAFFAVGNDRQRVHSWLSADRDGDGLVDLYERSDERNVVDVARVLLSKGGNVISLTWDAEKHPQADYEIELVTMQMKPIASARIKPEDRGKGYLRLFYDAPAATPAGVRVKRLAGAASEVFMRLRLWTSPFGHPDDFNGLQTARTFVFGEQPFLVFVGSLGKTEKGSLAPSAFSDIGSASDGRLIPHVLGPGQLLLDGEVHEGTSYASPFLTGIYSVAVGHNVKNVVERTASFAALDTAVAPHERSRWGVPAGALSRLREVVGPTKVEDVSHRIEGDELVVRFSLTRCCMEGMSWRVIAFLTDPATRQPLQYSGSGGAIFGATDLRSDRRDYVRHPFVVRVPLKGTEAFKGKPLRVVFAVSTKAWRTVRPIQVVDEAPDYRVKLN